MVWMILTAIEAVLILLVVLKACRDVAGWRTTFAEYKILVDEKDKCHKETENILREQITILNEEVALYEQMVAIQKVVATS